MTKYSKLDNYSKLVSSKGNKSVVIFMSVKPDEVWDSNPYRIIVESSNKLFNLLNE